MQWKKISVADNKGRSMKAWESDVYLICQDVQIVDKRGPTGRWAFALYHQDRYVAESETLEETKHLAKVHIRVGDDF